MQRPSSRRRKSAPKEPPSHHEMSQLSSSAPTQRRSSSASASKSRSLHRPWMITSCSLLVCVFITVAYYFQRRRGVDLQLPPHRFSSPHTHHVGGNRTSIFHDPDQSRPRIELHPEDHSRRDPVTQHLDWLVTSDSLRPDGVLKRVYLINGKQ